MRLPGEFALGAHFAGHPGHLTGEGVQLVDHLVDGVLQVEHLALGVHGDLLAQVTLGDGGRDLRDVTHLVGEAVGHGVDVVGQVLPDARHALDVGPTSELALRADLAGHPGDLVGKGVQLVDHGVDGVLQGQHLTLHVHLDLLGEIALGDGGRDLRDVTDLVGEVVRHGVDVLGEVLPDALDPTHVRPATECPLGAHLTGHPGHFVTEGGQLVHHRVDGVLQVEHLALHVDGDLLAQITPGHRRGHL